MNGSTVTQHKIYRKDIFRNKHEGIYNFNNNRTFDFVPNFI